MLTKRPGFPGQSSLKIRITCVNYAMDMMNEYEWMHGTANGGMDGWNGWMEWKGERMNGRMEAMFDSGMD